MSTSGISRDKTMDDKLIYISNDDKQNYHPFSTKTKKIPQKICMLRHKNEGLSLSFSGVFLLTPPLLIPHFYDVI